MKYYYKYDLPDGEFLESEKYMPKNIEYRGFSMVIEFSKKEVKKAAQMGISLLVPYQESYLIKTFGFNRKHIKDRIVGK